MIIRALKLRHGRLALPQRLTSYSPLQRRHQSTTEGLPANAQQIRLPEFGDSIASGAQAQLEEVSAVRTVALNDPNHPVALEYAFLQHQKAHTQPIGSTLTPYYRPHELLTNPPRPQDITLELLLASQAHIGHATSLWHPANARYIFGIRGRKQDGESPIHIISLDATAAHLRRACRVVSGVTERGGLVLFVGTREGQARAVVKAAEMAKGCHLFTKWTPGSITNGQQILGRCAKKVVDELDKEVPGFEDQLGTTAALKPDLVVCINPLENYVLLHECGLNNIPTIGVVDTDVNPTWVTYPIPANDDSLRSVQVIVGALGRAGEEGQALRKKNAARGVYPSGFPHGLTAPRRSMQPKKDFQERRDRSSRPPKMAMAEPVVPDDLEGVEVKQHEQDQKLLDDTYSSIEDEPQMTIPESASPDIEASQATTESTIDSTDDNDIDSPDKIDSSLLSEDYYDASSAVSDEDSTQFGGVEQLIPQSSTPARQSTTPSSEPDLQATQAPAASPLDQVDDVQKELGEEPDVEPPMENVDRVGKELGEEEATPSNQTAVPSEPPSRSVEEKK